MSSTDRLTYLLEKVRSAQAEVKDLEELIGMIDADDDGDIVRRMNAFHDAERLETLPYDVPYWKSVLQEVMAAGRSLEEVEAPIHQLPVSRYYRRWVAVAACILVLLGAGTYLFWGNKQPVAVTREIKNDVPPGGNKATLTLASGATILLDSSASGVLAQQGNTEVLKTNKGQLAYTTTNEKSTEVFYNTLTTPRGGQYRLILPDGSRVWLNAASSIRYPTAFSGADRAVDIMGEVYFEIAGDAARPFVVRVGGKGEVKVLGTRFNVNAYDDEPVVRTTLLEGSVKVTKQATSVVLKPGEQAEWEQTGGITLVPDPDIAQTLAWKDGLFSFNGADIHTILRQIVRWYDVDVTVKGDIREKFHLEISRNTNISNVFGILEATGGLHVKIDGKKILVTQ